MSFKKEPVLWIGAAVIVLQTLMELLNSGEPWQSGLLAALTAGLTYLARTMVTPVKSKEEGDTVE